MSGVLKYRRIAVAATSSAMVLATAFAVVPAITDASWTDQVNAKGTVKANVVLAASSGWAKATPSSYTNYNVANNSVSFSPWTSPLHHLSIDNSVKVDSPTSGVTAKGSKNVIDGGSSHFGIRKKSGNNSSENDSTGCAWSAAIATSTTEDACGTNPTASNPLTAQNIARVSGLHLSSATPNLSYFNDHVAIRASAPKTAVSCQPGGSTTALEPTAGPSPSPSQPNAVQLWGQYLLSGGFPLASNALGEYINVPLTSGAPSTLSNVAQVSGWRRVIVTSYKPRDIFVHFTLRARQVQKLGYALSDLTMTVETYTAAGAYLGTFQSVISRSECGVKIGSSDPQPVVTFDPYSAPPASVPTTIPADATTYSAFGSPVFVPIAAPLVAPSVPLRVAPTSATPSSTTATAAQPTSSLAPKPSTVAPKTVAAITSGTTSSAGPSSATPTATATSAATMSPTTSTTP